MRRFKLISLGFCLFSFSCSKPKTDWQPYYESQYKSPYGTYVFHNELEYMFEYAQVDDIKGSTFDYFEYFYEERYSTYFYINPFFFPNAGTVERLMKYAEHGNSLFIATTSPIPLFEEKGLKIKSSPNSQFKCRIEGLKGPSRVFESIDERKQTMYYFSSLPETTQVLGSIQLGDTFYPNFVAWNTTNGLGRIYVHAGPAFFSNYSMLYGSLGSYPLNCLSHLIHDEYFLWDGFGTYRRYTQGPQSGGLLDQLRFILSNKSLSMALLVLAGGLVLFLLFNYKRETRILPVFNLPSNSTKEFIRLVSDLYRREKDLTDLARHRVNFMLDQIRHKYHLDTSDLNNEFEQKLSERSGIPRSSLRVLVSQLSNVRTGGSVSKNDFIRFNRIIELYINKLDLYHGITRT